MTAAVAALDRTLCRRRGAITTVCDPSSRARATASWWRSHGPATPSHAPLALQQAPLAPIRMRIGVHTGDVQLRDEGNYIGPTINRAARLRDLAHGGQTVLSGTTHDLVADQLSDEVWVADLGTYPLRDLPRPERVDAALSPGPAQRVPAAAYRRRKTVQRLPVQLTSFIGRHAQIGDVHSVGRFRAGW